jgi:hypothetical protein
MEPKIHPRGTGTRFRMEPKIHPRGTGTRFRMEPKNKSKMAWNQIQD